MPELLQPVLSVLFVQLFWASIVAIGWSLVTVLMARQKLRIVDWAKLPIALQFFISTALGFTVFGLFTVAAYTLALPIWTLTLFYLCCLVAAGKYIYQNHRTSIATYIRTAPKKFKPRSLISPFGLMLLVAGADLGLNLLIGGFAGGDAFVHISKVRHLLDAGFTLTDGYYGTIPETRHSVSLLHTLIAIPSSLGLGSLASWYASGMFFKLVKIAAIFSLAWQLLGRVGRPLRLQYVSLAVILALGLFNNYFTIYPAIFGGVWMILLILALFELVRHQTVGLLCIASVLLAVTHPLAALAAALLIGLVSLAILVFERGLLNRKVVVGLIVSFVVLMSMPIFTSTLPNRMSDNARDYAATSFNYYKAGDLIAFRPNGQIYFASDSFIFTPRVIVLVSLLGMVGLFGYVKDRRSRIILCCLLAYVPLILYNPLSFKLLTKILPVWGISRLWVINQLTMVMFFFGLLTLVKILGRVVTISPKKSLALLTIASFVTFLLTQTYGAIDPTNKGLGAMYGQQKKVYAALEALPRVLPDDKYAVVMAEQSWVSFIIPVVAPLHVVAINEPNAPPAADTTSRQACYVQLYKTLDPSYLRQANVDYVLASNRDKDFYALAAQQQTLIPQKKTDEYVLYKFDGHGVKQPLDKRCVFNE